MVRNLVLNTGGTMHYFLPSTVLGSITFEEIAIRDNYW